MRIGRKPARMSFSAMPGHRFNELVTAVMPPELRPAIEELLPHLWRLSKPVRIGRSRWYLSQAARTETLGDAPYVLTAVLGDLGPHARAAPKTAGTQVNGTDFRYEP